MEKVNANREFKPRSGVCHYSLWGLDNVIVHPFRLEYIVPEEDNDEFKNYLDLVLTSIFGVSNLKIKNTHRNTYIRYYITLNIEEKDLEFIDRFLLRALDGLEKNRKGIVFKFTTK